MSNTFKIGVESREKEIPKFNNETEVLENTFKKKPDSKFENTPLANLNPYIDLLSDDFKTKLTNAVNTPPDPETKKRKPFTYNGYLYGVTYSEQFETFSLWRMKSEGQGSGSGGQYRQKPTVLYNLQKLYEGEVDSVNDILDQFNEKKERYDQISLVNVFQNKDGKLVYVMKRDKVVILGQQQEETTTTKKEEVKPQQ